MLWQPGQLQQDVTRVPMEYSYSPVEASVIEFDKSSSRCCARKPASGAITLSTCVRRSGAPYRMPG